MLMQIKHYRFERMDETTVTFDLLINTDRIIRVNRAVATDSLPVPTLMAGYPIASISPSKISMRTIWR